MSSNLDVLELGKFVSDRGFSMEVESALFDNEVSTILSFWMSFFKNENKKVDGEAFIQLTEADLKVLVPLVGVRAKLRKLVDSVSSWLHRL